jgi:hypothetical protein
MNKGRRNYLQVENASINYAHPKRYIKKSDRESNRINTAFSVKTAIKIILITSIVSFANKFILITDKTKTMTSGLVAIIVSAG